MYEYAAVDGGGPANAPAILLQFLTSSSVFLVGTRS